MKRALVVAMVCALFIGLGAFAQFTGEWGTTVTFYPAASSFSTFASFGSDLDVTYEVSGWEFAMESGFAPAGLTDMSFSVDGALGAFMLAAEVNFVPMFMTSYAVVYGDVQTAAGCAGFTTVAYGTKTETKGYTAIFDDARLTAELSIAGVDLGAMFLLVGAREGAEYAYTWFNATPSYATAFASQIDDAVDPLEVDTSVANGAGWKLYGSGSMGNMDVTANLWMNLADYDLYTVLKYFAGYPDFKNALSNKFSWSGNEYLVCADCIARFTGFDILLEGFEFACVDVSIFTAFDCCGWNGIAFLLEDIGLGCCWDMSFDMLIDYTATSKTVTVAPDFAIANSCFTIEAGIDFDTSDGFAIQGFEIYGVGLSYSWNGITFNSETSFNVAMNPILGSFASGGLISSPTKVTLWSPVEIVVADFIYDDDGEICDIDGTVDYVLGTDGSGWYELKEFACEKASVWEYYEIDVDGDGCCGGGFDLTAGFYFGDILVLDDIDGEFFFDEDSDGSYAGDKIEIYGDEDTVGAGVSTYSSCNCCPCEDCSQELIEMEWDTHYTEAAGNSLFSWIKTTIEGSVGLSSNFDLTFGLAVSVWGWEELEVGFDFSF